MNLGLMRFLTDENVSPKVVAYLRKCGADVLDIKEYGWQGKTDHEILEKARILILLLVVRLIMRLAKARARQYTAK